MTDRASEDDAAAAGAFVASWLGEQLISDAAARLQQEQVDAVVAREGHAALLIESPTTWNMWRQLHPEQWVDLGAVDLRGASLAGARLNRTAMNGADLSWANLRGAYLGESHLNGATFDGADLTGAFIRNADLTFATFLAADLTDAKLMFSTALAADFTGAVMVGCELRFVNLTLAKLTGADLTDSELTFAVLVDADIDGAILAGSQVYGISAWDLTGVPADQRNLTITPRPPPDVPAITVDDIRVAQLIHLMLGNEQIRNVIDTVTSKAVVILGRFSDEFKPILDAVRDELRRRNYLPIVFDFERPGSRDLTETIVTLTHLARFVIADLSGARSIGHELMATVEDLPSVAFQPIIAEDEYEYAMFEHVERYPWMLPVFRYEDRGHLLGALSELIANTEETVARLRTTIRPSDPPDPEAGETRPRRRARPVLPPLLLAEAEAFRHELAAPRLVDAERDRLDDLVLGSTDDGKPRSPADHLFLGNRYFDVGDLHGAVAEYSAAIGLDPQFADAHYNRGSVYLHLGVDDRAIEDLSRTIRLQPDHPSAYLSRGIAYRTRGEHTLAIADFGSGLDHGGDRVEYRLQRALTRLLAGAPEDAVADIDAALVDDPDNTQAYRFRGAAHAQTGDLARAVEDYARAIELGDGSALAFCLRGHAHLNVGDHTAALADLDHAVTLDSTLVSAVHGRGIARRDTGDNAGAEDDFTIAIALAPDEPDHHADRGFVRAARGDVRGAIADYDRALELDPDHVVARYNRACAYSLQQAPGSIVVDLAQAVSLDPALREQALADEELAWARSNLAEVDVLLGSA